MKRETLGTLFLVLGSASIFLALSGYAMVSFVITSAINAGAGDSLALTTELRLARILLGFLPLLGLLFFIPLGVYLISTAGKKM